mmetsp:Transcript_41403/g.103473  ORF Transcript_41403/g.103473 Transcript_41403/m.103473 type:complete len:209 (+) Transcript_41403:343-969(+)
MVGGIDTGVHLHVVDDSVGQSLQSVLNVQHELVQTVSATSTASIRVEVNRKCGEGLVQLTLEGQSKGAVAVLVVLQIALVGQEVQLLDLVLMGVQQVVSLVHDIITVLAQSLGAINITILGVALTAASLVAVPAVVWESVGVLGKETVNAGHSVLVISLDLSERHVLNILAAAMTGAIIRTGSSLAALAFISGEALAFTGASVANTLI